MCNVAFTLNSYDDQKRNLTFVKTNLQILKLKCYACDFKQAFYPLHKLYTSRGLDSTKYFYTNFSFGTWLSNLHV